MQRRAAQRADGVVGRQALEPTIALDKAGNAFFPAGYFGPPDNSVGSHRSSRSRDGNKSWEDIEPATATGEDPPKDLDPWVYADADFGRIFDIGLIGAGSYLSYSDDGGETWQSSAVTDPGVNDHQSIVTAVAPDANTLLAPLDPAFPKLVYYCVNEVSRTGCVLSRDGGRSWIPTGGSAYSAHRPRRRNRSGRRPRLLRPDRPPAARSPGPHR